MIQHSIPITSLIIVFLWSVREKLETGPLTISAESARRLADILYSIKHYFIVCATNAIAIKLDDLSA